MTGRGGAVGAEGLQEGKKLAQRPKRGNSNNFEGKYMGRGKHRAGKVGALIYSACFSMTRTSDR